MRRPRRFLRGFQGMSRTARNRRVVISRKRRRIARRSFHVARRFIPNLRLGGRENLELKFTDKVLTQSPASIAWINRDPDNPLSICLNSVSIGNDAQTRIGRRINMRSLLVNVTVGLDVAVGFTTVSPAQEFSFAIVIDTQANQAQMDPLNVYEPAPFGFSIHAPRNLNFTSRFRVLKRWNGTINPIVSVNNTTESSVSTESRPLTRSFFFNLNNMVVTFEGSAIPATVAQIVDNAIHVIVTATSPLIHLAYTSRVRFTG